MEKFNSIWFIYQCKSNLLKTSVLYKVKQSEVTHREKYSAYLIWALSAFYMPTSTIGSITHSTPNTLVFHTVSEAHLSQGLYISCSLSLECSSPRTMHGIMTFFAQILSPLTYYNFIAPFPHPALFSSQQLTLSDITYLFIILAQKNISSMGAGNLYSHYIPNT